MIILTIKIELSISYLSVIVSQGSLKILFCIFNVSAQTCVRLIQVLNASDHQSVTSWADGVTQSRKIELVKFKTNHYRTYSSQSKEPPGSNVSNASGGGSKKTTPPGTSKGTSVGGNKGGHGGDKKGGSGEWWCPKCGEPCTHVDAYVCK